MSEEPIATVVPLIVILRGLAKVGFDFEPFTVAQLLVQASLPTSTHTPSLFL